MQPLRLQTVTTLMSLASGFQVTTGLAGVSKVSGAGVVAEKPRALAVVSEDLHRLVPTDFAHLPDAGAGVGSVIRKSDRSEWPVNGER